MNIGCQFSVYPLRKEHLSEIIHETARELQSEGLHTQVGPVSTYVEGEESKVFDTLRKAYGKVSKNHDVVMVTTFSNIAPRLHEK